MFGNLLKAVVNTATLPVDVAADALTLGGVLTDKDEPYTAEKLKRIKDNLDDAGK